MNSSEEYLDSLLRAAMESDDNEAMGPAEAYREDMLTDVDSPVEDKVGQKEGNSAFDSMSSDPNKALSPEEIEAMFAAFDNSTIENTETETKKSNDEAGINFEDDAFLAELESLAFGTSDMEQEQDTEAMNVVEEPTFTIEELNGMQEAEETAMNNDEMIAELESLVFGSGKDVSDLEEITFRDEEDVSELDNLSFKDEEDALDLEGLAFGDKEAVSDLESLAFGDKEAVSDLEGLVFGDKEDISNLAGSAFGDKEAVSDLESLAFEDKEDVSHLESFVTVDEEDVSEIDNLSFGNEENALESGNREGESDDIDLFAEPDFDLAQEEHIPLSEGVDTKADEDLLESLAIDDDELAEINELLKQSEHDEMMEDDMLAMLEKASSEHESGEVEEDSFDFFKESEEEEQEGEKEEASVETEIKSKKAKKREKKKKEKKERKGFFGRKRKEKEVEQIAENEQEEAENEEILLDESSPEGGAEQPVGETEQEMLDLFSQFSSGDSVFGDDSGFGDDFFSQFGDGEELILSMGEEHEELKKKSGEQETKEKKGFWGRLFDLLTEEEEEEEIKEKPKKEKKKKGKKSKSENEEIIDELEAEDENADKKKKKKAKKVKKEKKPKAEDILVAYEKKLPKKMVIRIFALCLSLLLLIVLISNGLLAFVSLKHARSAFYDKDYASVYENMLGADLNESDSIILEKATLVLRLERKYDSYINYMNMGNQVYALHALLSGLQLYQELYEEATSQKITEEFELVKTLIVDALETTFGISEQKAFEIINFEDALEYQRALDEVVGNLQVEEANVIEDKR